GPLPEPTEWLLRLAEIRLLAARWQIAQVRLEGQGSADVESRIESSGTKVEARAARSARSSRPSPAAAPASILYAQSSVPRHRIIDVVLQYRSPRQIARLAERSQGRLRIVDEQSAYFRLKAAEEEPLGLYRCLKHLLRLPDASL